MRSGVDFLGGQITRRLRISIASFLLILAFLFFVILPGAIESHFNTTMFPPPYQASQAARDLNASLWIADLHADSLLWGRNLLERDARGHVDLPRLIQGNVALQIFSLPTKTPWGLNIERNTDRGDQITWLAVAERWPLPSWKSLTARALYQARRLQQMTADSHGEFALIQSASDLSAYEARRKSNQAMVAAILSIEGAHALDGKLENLDVLFDRGYRMMSPSHFFDNDIAGSSAGVDKSGLSEKGRAMIRRMESKRMIVDLAHASPRTIDDVLAIATRPVVVSHTGLKATCNNNRNLSDAQIQAVAKNGGLIGIGYWPTATCGHDAAAIVRSMRHVVDLVGADHVALGSDFDGAVEEPFDTSGLVKITEALLDAGFSEDQIRLIMGGNVLQFLKQNLP